MKYIIPSNTANGQIVFAPQSFVGLHESQIYQPQYPSKVCVMNPASIKISKRQIVPLFNRHHLRQVNFGGQTKPRQVFLVERPMTHVPMVQQPLMTIQKPKVIVNIKESN